MTSTRTSMLAAATAEYERQRMNAAELYRELNAVTETVISPRQVVKVTVGAHGELQQLSFPSPAFKNLTANELAAVILKTVSQAQLQARTRSAALLAPSLPAGVSAEELFDGSLDLQAILPEVPRSAEDDTSRHGPGARR